MLNVDKLQELVQRDKDLWLTLTEESFKKGLYGHPHNYKATYKGNQVSWFKDPQTDGQRYMNMLVTNEVIDNVNHLIDYVKAAILKKRDEYVEPITKLVSKYETYLDGLGIRRDENGYYKQLYTS